MINILLIEDNPPDCRLIEEYLKESEAFKFTLLLAGRLSTGFDHISKKDLDIILVDLGLPDSQGIATVEKVLKKETGLPIIILTGLDDIEKTKDALHKGIQDYLVKGQFDGRILVKSIIFSIERKKSEIILKTEKEMAQRYLDIAGVMLIVVGADGKVSLINKKGCEILGYVKDDIIGKDWFDNFLPKKIKPEIKKVAKKIFSGETRLVEDYENLVLTRSGEERMISWHNTILNDENGKIIALLSSGNDITEKKEAEDEIKNSYLKLQKTLKNTIDALASIVEIKDPYTSGHQKKVAALSVAIAEALGLDKDKIEAVGTVAIIHDIGKISIPPSILARPGKISSLEYDMIKTHSQLGYEMIKRIEFPWPIADIILQHHERLDGSGYPNGLKDKDILLEAKIIAVADVVEAMSSHRPYRPALGIEEALKEIKKGKGKSYDPVIVETCIRLFKNKGFQFNQ